MIAGNSQHSYQMCRFSVKTNKNNIHVPIHVNHNQERNYMGISQGRSIQFVYFLLIQTVESRIANVSLEKEYMNSGKENEVLEENVVFHP